MAFTLSGGDEGFTKNLDIFSVPDTETGIQETYIKQYKPVSVFSSCSPVIFQVDNPSADYIDVHNMRLNLSYTIFSDKNLAWDDKNNEFCGPINLGISSFFSQCDLELNQTNVNSSTGHNYGYKAYIDTVLTSGLGAANSYLPASGYYKDNIAEMDDFTGENNLHLRKRALLTKKGRIVKLVGRIHADFCNQKKSLINGVPLTLRLRNADDKFRLMWDDGLGDTIGSYEEILNKKKPGTSKQTSLFTTTPPTAVPSTADPPTTNPPTTNPPTTVPPTTDPPTTDPPTTDPPPTKKPVIIQNYKLVLVDISLSVPFQKIHPTLLMEHNKLLSTKPAVYPMTRSEIKSFTVPASVGEWCGQNIFNDKIPKQLIICMVDSLAYAGNPKKNPYNFQHFYLTDIYYEVNNRIVNRAMSLDFVNKHYNDGFVSIFNMMRTLSMIPPHVEMKDFDKGFAFFCFDLENTKEENILSPMIKGNSRLFLKFMSNLARSISILAYGMFDSVVYIDQARNVVHKEG